MKNISTIKSKILYVIFIVMISILTANAQTFYVDCINGKDTNSGFEGSPLKTLLKAAETVNNADGSGGITLKIMPGIYSLDAKVVFDCKTKLTELKRLVIEAAVLPDDTNWMPVSMPVIISTAVPTNNFGFECSVGFDIKKSHVTIRGLKFLGNPTGEIYYYPVARQDKKLVDLEITQCLFVGDKDAAPIQSGILAHGNEIVVDHCIFFNCKNSVVYYFADDNREVKRTGSAMRYCIVYGAYEAGIWTASPDEDFQFHNNIISDCEKFWVHNEINKTVYNLRNSVITDNNHFITKVTSSFEFSESDIKYTESDIIRSGDIRLVMKNDIGMPKEYLNIAEGTTGCKLNAGLFIK